MSARMEIGGADDVPRPGMPGNKGARSGPQPKFVAVPRSPSSQGGAQQRATDGERRPLLPAKGESQHGL